MKSLKLLVGTMALLFVALHLMAIPGRLQAEPGEYAFSEWMGRAAAILIGSAIAAAMFRGAARRSS